MESELIVIAFPRAEDAQKAWQAMRIMREQQALGLQYSAVTSTDSTGHAEIQFGASLPLDLHDRNLWLMCEFVNALYCRNCERTGQLVEAGVDKVFLEELRGALVPGTSALVIFEPHEGKADVSRLSTVLSLFTGRLFHATFPDNVQAAILGLNVKAAESATAQTQPVQE